MRFPNVSVASLNVLGAVLISEPGEEDKLDTARGMVGTSCLGSFKPIGELGITLHKLPEAPPFHLQPRLSGSARS